MARLDQMTCLLYSNSESTKSTVSEEWPSEEFNNNGIYEAKLDGPSADSNIFPAVNLLL